MCATVVAFKTKHTVGGDKISFARPDIHVQVIETKLHNITMYEKQRLFSLNCKCLQKLIVNEPAERRRSAGEAAENSAAQRMLYAEKFSIDL